MNKEDVVHIYNRLLLRHKRYEIGHLQRYGWTSWMVFIQSEVKSEKETSYINVYAWACARAHTHTHTHTHTPPNKTVEMTFLKGRNRDTDMWTLGGKRGWDELRDWN